MHFSTGRQIFYIGDLIFYGDYTGTKAFVTAADLIEGDGNLHCFMPPLSSCEIKISVVSQCRILVAVQYMNTQVLTFCFRLTACTCWTAQWLGHYWRWLMQTELADWQQMHKLGNTTTNLKIETNSDSCHTVHRLYTAWKQYTAACSWYVNDGKAAAFSAAVSWRHHAQV